MSQFAVSPVHLGEEAEDVCVGRFLLRGGVVVEVGFCLVLGVKLLQLFEAVVGQVREPAIVAHAFVGKSHFPLVGASIHPGVVAFVYVEFLSGLGFGGTSGLLGGLFVGGGLVSEDFVEFVELLVHLHSGLFNLN